MDKTAKIVIGLIVVVVLVWAGYSLTKPKEIAPIKIGAILPLTGDLAAQATGKNAGSIVSTLAYDSINIIAQTIEKIGNTDKDSIRGELVNTNYQGVTYQNPIVFDTDGDLKGAQYQMMVVKDNQTQLYEIQ